MSDENKATPAACYPAGCSVDPVVLPLPLGLAQRSAKCRICGESFAGNGGMPKGWAHEFGEMLYPVHVVLNYGDECAHAKCLERQNAERSNPAPKI